MRRTASLWMALLLVWSLMLPAAAETAAAAHVLAVGWLARLAFGPQVASRLVCRAAYSSQGPRSGSGASGFGISKPDVAVVAGEEAAFATGSEREW